MSKKFLVLNDEERKGACNKKTAKPAEQFYNDEMLKSLSSNFSFYFDILKNYVFPALGITGNGPTLEYAGQTSVSIDTGDPRFYFEYGVYGGSDITDFQSSNLALDRFKLGLAVGPLRTLIPSALSKIKAVIQAGHSRYNASKPSLEDLNATRPLKIQDDLFTIIGKRLTSIESSLKDKKVTDLNIGKALRDFIIKLDSGDALHQLVAFYPQGSLSSAWTKIGDYLPTLDDNAKDEIYGFRADGAAIIAIFNEDSKFRIGRDLVNWKSRLIDKLENGCDTLGDTKGAKLYSNSKDRDRARLANLQCVLPMLEEFYAKPSHAELAKLVPFSSNIGFRGKPLAINKTFKGKREFYKPKEFPIVFANSDKPAFFINDLYSRGNNDAMRSFTELTNAEASQLVPKIEISKIRYKPAGSDNEVIIPFDFSRKTELTNKQLYKREDAGIERVRFRMLGRNPAEVDKYISCEVSLYFDSVNAFLKQRKAIVDGTEYDYSYKDFLMRHTKINQNKVDKKKLQKDIKASFGGFKNSKILKKDLLKQISAFEAGLNSRDIMLDVANEKYFRIRIDLGWQPYGDLNTNLKNFLELSNLSLYLTLQTHSFSFASDGSVSLKLNYMGSVEGQLIQGLQTNIFISERINRATRVQSALNQILALADALDNQDNQMIKIISNLTKLRKNIITFAEEEATSKQKQLFDNLTVDKNLMRNLSGKTAKIGPTHILKGQIPQEYAGYGTSGVTNLLSSQQKSKLTGRRSNMVVSTNIVMDKLMEDYRNARLKSGTNRKKAKSRRTDSDIANDRLNKIKYKMVEKSSGGGFKDLDGRRAPKGPSKQTELLKKKSYKSSISNHTLRKLTQGAPPVEFYFTRFGSLLYAAIESIWHENPRALKDTVFVLGPIKFLSPQTGKPKYTNFAQLPILLDTWNNFFSKKVLAEGPQGETTRNSINYPLMRYFHDLVNNLLLNGVLASCSDRTNATNPLRLVEPKISIFTAKRSRSAGQKVGFHPHEVKKVAQGATKVSYQNPNVSLTEISGKNAMPFAGKTPFSKNLGDNPVDIKNFVVLYDGGSSGASIENKYDTNIKNNIMHFFIGANRGIMRDIRFDKSDIRGFQEAKVLDEGDIEGGLLREKYDANVSLLGTSYFMQGMKFYLDPTFVGMSPDAATTLQRDIGLGGYYVITDVHSDITPNDFETSIHGSWVSYGKGK